LISTKHRAIEGGQELLGEKLLESLLLSFEKRVRYLAKSFAI
jgi:hypothetical protein